MPGSLHNVAATAKRSVPANVNHCNSSLESSLTLSLYWHFSLISEFISQVSNTFIGAILPALSSLRKFIMMCCTKPWQLSRNGWSLVGSCRRIWLFFALCLHSRFWLSSRRRICSLYIRKLRRKQLQAARSARPTTPATASVCMGCAANVTPATAVPTLAQYCGKSLLAVVTTKAVAKQWNKTLSRW